MASFLSNLNALLPVKDSARQSYHISLSLHKSQNFQSQLSLINYQSFPLRPTEYTLPQRLCSYGIVWISELCSRCLSVHEGWPGSFERWPGGFERWPGKFER